MIETYQAQLDLLCEVFNVEKPNLIIWNRNHSAYSSLTNTINMRTRISPFQLTLEDSLLHEFAHYLTRRISGNEYQFDYFTGRRRRQVSPHGKEFFNNLLKVIAVWHDNIDKYSWSGEYKRIQQYAKPFRNQNAT
jgi:hypothetical protein